jgi:hypothetical protein
VPAAPAPLPGAGLAACDCAGRFVERRYRALCYAVPGGAIAAPVCDAPGPSATPSGPGGEFPGVDAAALMTGSAAAFSGPSVSRLLGG